MGKELDKFMKDYPKIAKEVQALSVAEGEKRKKALVAHLNKTWAAEDLVQEAVQKARQSGVQGKKTADFLKEAPVAKALKPWRAALATHAEGLKGFEGFCAQAKMLRMDLEKRLGLVQKEMKKEGGTGDIKVMAKVKEAQRAVTDLKKAGGLVGTLQAPVVMYGANLQRTLDGVVKTALAEVDPKEFPKAFEEANRPRTARILKDNVRKIDKHCKLGLKLVEAGDLGKTDKLVKEVRSLLDELEALDKEGKKTVKTMKKELSSAKDGKEIAQMIKVAALSAKKCGDQLEALLEAISEAEEAAED